MTQHRISRRSLVRGSVAGATLLAAGSTASRAAAADGTRTQQPPALDTRALQAAISDLSHPPATSSQLRVAAQEPKQHWYGTAGQADLAHSRPPRPDDRFRAGSVTKAFVATVVLQLWNEQRVDLDAPIGRYLPGVLPSHFARGITVTQLLNHTSGLPNHEGLPDDSTPEGVLRHRFDQWTPPEWIATIPNTAFKFPPGTKQHYRGINYVLLALLIEELTGQRYGEAIAARILRPLGLSRTLLPGNDTHLHGPHIHGYLRMTDGTLEDVTVYNMSNTWGEGELISTVNDLASFQQALFSGKLLPQRAVDKLCTLPPATVRMLDGSPARYGMGLQTATVNGVTFWGKTGEVYGYRTRMFSTRDQSLRFVLNYTHTPLTTDEDMTNRVVAILTS
jgi:D-alanyl-D-alanine carboxypeptidase